MHTEPSSPFHCSRVKSADSSILPCGQEREQPVSCRVPAVFAVEALGDVRAASFDMTLVLSSSLGRCCFLQMCHLVSCPEQVLCPRRNQLNILRQKVETQPTPVTPLPPPPPSSVYDVSTRITLHPICPHHGATLPFPALPWYRQHQRHDVKRKQYVCTSLVLVTLLP